MRVRPVLIAAAVLAPLAAKAESVLFRGEERLLGWPVYDAQGQLGFTTCEGQTHAVADAVGSFQAADRTCSSPPAPFRLEGQVRAIAPERSRLELVDGSGAAHALYLGPEAAASLAAFPPGEPIEVEGPVEGHAAVVRPAS